MAANLTAGRLGEIGLMHAVKYKPVGYVLSADKELEDERLQSRKKMVQAREQRLAREAIDGLQRRPDFERARIKEVTNLRITAARAMAYASGLSKPYELSFGRLESFESVVIALEKSDGSMVSEKPSLFQDMAGKRRRTYYPLLKICFRAQRECRWNVWYDDAKKLGASRRLQLPQL